MTIRQATEILARRLWEESGKPEGRDLEFWLRAENVVKSYHSQNLRSPKRKNTLEFQ